MIRESMEVAPVTPRHSLLRDLTALILIAVACPIALFGGSMLGCVGQGFNTACAMNAIAVSPVLLLAAGAGAGLITRGWTGLLVVVTGTLIGMTAILVLSFGVDDPVPVDPVSGVIAMAWFLAPVSIGYGIGRLLWHLMDTREGTSRA